MNVILYASRRSFTRHPLGDSLIRIGDEPIIKLKVKELKRHFNDLKLLVDCSDLELVQPIFSKEEVDIIQDYEERLDKVLLFNFGLITDEQVDYGYFSALADKLANNTIFTIFISSNSTHYKGNFIMIDDDRNFIGITNKNKEIYSDEYELIQSEEIIASVLYDIKVKNLKEYISVFNIPVRPNPIVKVISDPDPVILFCMGDESDPTTLKIKWSPLTEAVTQKKYFI